MDMKKTAKKIAALVAGTTMLGATIMGATALDLSNYPAPFVTNGVFSGKIVVGSRAATSDVVGAIDLAASLQASAKSSTEVDVPGAAGEASVSGDAAEFRTGSDIVSFEEQLGTVKQTFTASDLDALKNGVIDTGVSSTPTKQYLKFGNTTMKVVYEEDSDNDKLGDFLKLEDGTYVFEYHLEFTEGAESDITSGALQDYENEVLSILGAPFTITNAAVSGNDLTLELLGGQVADVLRDGETKTYTIDGKDYEVTAVFISDGGTAKLSVNGVMTKELSEGRTEVLGEDVTVGVQSVLTNNREGLVEFYLGANKLKFLDSDQTTAGYADETVEIRGESVNDDLLILYGSNTSSRHTLNYIKYMVAADDDLYVPAGGSVKEAVEENNEGAFLTDTWDVKYAGLVKTGSSPVKLNAVSDHSYKLQFTNVNGDSIEFPFVTNKAGSANRWGDDDDDLIFVEANGTTFPIGDNDYFVVSDKNSATDDKAATKVLRWQSINTGDSTVTFKDLAGGDLVVSYTGTTGDLIVDGVTHSFVLNASLDALRVDLNGDSDITGGEEVNLVAEGGLLIDLGYQSLSNTTGAVAALPNSSTVTFTTEGSRFDESGSNEASTFVVNTGTAGEVHLDTFDLGGSTNDLVSDPDNDDYERGYTSYGAYWEVFDSSTATEAEELTVDYPSSQRYPQVFVTAGVVEVKEGAMGESGKFTTENVNPIAVGLAVLDTEAPAVGSAKLIVVGGPCANTVAAELMGNPEDCAEGFTPGKAVIKLFSDKNALLVAGYSAQDTLGASYVLADYADYQLSGSEVEVVVADLNTITVNKVG